MPAGWELGEVAIRYLGPVHLRQSHGRQRNRRGGRVRGRDCCSKGITDWMALLGGGFVVLAGKDEVVAVN
jgi:hypothetical protein